MKCDKAQEFFSDYIENTLDRPMTVALEAHLNGCDSCSADVASLRSMWTVLDKVPQVEPPADFVWKTTTRLQNEFLNRQEAQRAQPVAWWKRLTMVQTLSFGAAAALLAIGLWAPVVPSPLGTTSPSEHESTLDAFDRSPRAGSRRGSCDPRYRSPGFARPWSGTLAMARRSGRE